MKRNLCIIPARGGSKRIPRKNIKNFLGRPIISYSIEVAIKSELFDEIIVSTDDSEISEIAYKLGAKVPFKRSSDNSDDFATTVDVVNEVLVQYSEIGINFQNICVLYPTAPLVSVQNLKKGYSKLANYDAVIPVVKFDFPVWRSFEINKDLLQYRWPEFESMRSQDLQPLYHDAGQWYWIKNNRWPHTSLVKTKTHPLEMSVKEVQDIDTLSDWSMAELKYKLLYENV
jgi:pseudaminic acid cytidylyltransferase